MCAAELEPTAISHSAGISAREEHEQRRGAPSTCGVTFEATLEPAAIIYRAGASARERGERWHRALSLLGDMDETRLDLQRQDTRIRERQPVAAGPIAGQRGGHGEV